MPMPSIDFWFDLGSPYSYLAAFRIERVAREAGVAIRWRPFLLGAIFKARGLTDTPFALYPARGQYMAHDVARQGAMLGLAFHLPEPFPQISTLAARIALIGFDRGWGEAFCRAVFTAEFADRKPIDDPDIMAGILRALGLDADEILDASLTAANKLRLREATDEALRLGIFGAPSFVTEDHEIFWGNDRLEQALHWAKHHA